jgi:hypothetical protein
MGATPKHPTTTTPPPTAAVKDLSMSPHSINPDQDRRRRGGLAGGRVASLLAMLAVALGSTAASAIADECPNAVLRVQSNSTHLPDCRAYELVNNPFKEGFAPNIDGYTDDGAVSYTSSGNFADNGLGAPGNQYLATRSSTGWKTTASSPSGPAYLTKPAGAAEEISADLRSSIWLMRRAEQPGNVLDFYLRGPDGAFTRIGPSANPATLPSVPPSPNPTNVPEVNPVGESADLSHVLFTILTQDAYDPVAGTTNLYEYVGTGNARPRLVGVDNTGHPVNNSVACANGISADGRVVFFAPGCDGGGQVWARIDGVTSVEASASECARSAGDPGGLCTGSDDAHFAGAAGDGSRVFFTTSQQLVDGDIDQSSDVYACDIPSGTPAPVGVANSCATLTEVSARTGGGGQVESVAGVSKDGSRVYFVAQGMLAANPGANGLVALPGAHNLYVWRKDGEHPAGQTVFVARLDVNDTGADNAFQLSADGRYVVLSTTTALIDSGPQADTDSSADVYRYDSETGALVRLSTATSGQGGNEPGFDTAMSGKIGSAVSADGGTVTFFSSEALSPDDVNGQVDVYEWRGGQVSLISSGRPSPPNTLPFFALVSASGTDVFFNSTEQLTPADGDTNPDIYDARVGGGFDYDVPRACTGDECQGQHSSTPAAGVSRSDGPVGPDDPVVAAPAFSVAAVSASQRRRLAATGRVVLTIKASTPGVVSATATATVAGRSSQVGSAHQTMARAGTARLRVVLSKAARTRLKRVGRLTVGVVVEHSRVAGTRSVTLKLTRPGRKVGGRS